MSSLLISFEELFSNSCDIELPIDTNTIIRSYRIHAYLLNIIQNQPNYLDFVTTNYLCLHNKSKGIDYLDFQTENCFIGTRSGFYDNGWFLYNQFDINKLDNKLIIKKAIIDHLARGYYTIHIINEAYLPHSSFYHMSDFYNMEMTCGYCERDDSFFVLDYDRNGIFCKSKVKADDYLEAIVTVKLTNVLLFIKSKEGLSFSFDRERAKKLLKCHIESVPPYPYILNFEHNIVGYSAINRSISVMKQNGPDMIRLRVIKEHKSNILRYFSESCKRGLDSSYFYEQYQPIAREMDRLFWIALKAKIQNKPMVIFDFVYRSIQEINKSEENIINEYLWIRR